MRAKQSGKSAHRRERAIRAAAHQALARLLEPLAAFALDAGFSVQEVETLLRVAAVRSVAKRQREVSRRVNISGIAASTGIPRAEISRILKPPGRVEVDSAAHARQQQATNRILSAWHEDPQFTKPNGQPAELKIFGPGATFDALVKRHGRGIPTRAMLDELEHAQALEVLPKQRVRAKALVAAKRGASASAIKALGDRAAEMLGSMLATVLDPDRHQFITHVEGVVDSVAMLPILRREVAARGADFLASMRETIEAVETPDQIPAAGRGPVEWIRIIVSYHEGAEHLRVPKDLQSSRRNFRRLKR